MRKTEQIGTKMDPPFLLMNPLGKWTKIHVFSLTLGTGGFCMISMKIRLFPALMKKHVFLTIFIRVSSTKMAGERKYQFAQFCALGRAKTDPNVLKMVFEKYILESVLSALIKINQGIVCEKCVKRSTCAKSTRKG